MCWNRASSADTMLLSTKVLDVAPADDSSNEVSIILDRLRGSCRNLQEQKPLPASLPEMELCFGILVHVAFEPLLVGLLSRTPWLASKTAWLTHKAEALAGSNSWIPSPTATWCEHGLWTKGGGLETWHEWQRVALQQIGVPSEVTGYLRR